MALEDPFTFQQARVAWPVLPAGLRAALTLTCDRCGNRLALQAAREPTDFQEIVAGFVTKHTQGGCH